MLFSSELFRFCQLIVFHSCKKYFKLTAIFGKKTKSVINPVHTVCPVQNLRKLVTMGENLAAEKMDVFLMS